MKGLALDKGLGPWWALAALGAVLGFALVNVLRWVWLDGYRGALSDVSSLDARTALHPAVAEERLNAH